MESAKKRLAGRWFALLLLHPFRLFRQNSSVLVVLLAVILFNLLTSSESSAVVAHLASRGWVFDSAPSILASILEDASILTVAVAVLLFVGKNTLNVLTAQQMMIIFRKQRATLIESVATLHLNSLLWLMCAELIVYATAILVVSTFYVPTYLLWTGMQLDLTWLLVLVGVVVYPAMYGSIATGALVSTLSTSNGERWRTVKSLLKAKSLVLLYAYYGARTTLEIALIGVGVFIFYGMLHNRILASLCIAAGLLVPFLFLRGASYALTLNLARHDETIARLFGAYFTREEIEGGDDAKGSSNVRGEEYRRHDD